MGKKNKAYKETKGAKVSGEKVPGPVPISAALREQIFTFDLDDTVTSMSFPSTLTSSERKAVHQYAANIGLKSKSLGKGFYQILFNIYKCKLKQIN